MSPVAAVCPEHGPFVSRAFKVTNSVNVTLRNNGEPCPRCGRPARVVDGTFHFDASGFATVLSAPQWTRDALQTIQRPLQVASIAVSRPEMSDEAVERIAARLADLLDKKDSPTAEELRKATKGKRRAQIVAVILGLAYAVNTAVDLYTAGEIAIDIAGIVREAFE